MPLSNENRTFGIALNIYYKNNSTPETHYQEFNANTDKKQTVCLSITPENDNEEVDCVAFAFVYGYNKNTMTVHNAMLNILSTNYTAEAAADSSDTSTESGGATDTESTETTQETEVDNYIDYEVISETLDTTQAYMQTSSVYDSTGNYATSQTDEAGNTVTYTYDVNGNITSTTDGEENVVNYTYDTSGAVSGVSSYDAQNTYTYNGANNISVISHNGFNYQFNYDVFQNLISTTIGDTVIASSTYSLDTGYPIKTAYANGDYFEYTYDEYDNVVKVTGKNGVLAEFVYNKKGLISKAIDNSSNITTYYYYNFNGDTTGEYRQLKDGGLSSYINDDSDGNQIERTSINGYVKSITIGTDSEENPFVINDGIEVSTITDDFGRATTVKTARGEGNSVFFTDYEYSSVGGTTATTNLVSKLTQKYGNTELINYEYEYNGNGNITKIFQNGTLTNSYKYDNLNQLTEEYDYIHRYYINYSYDRSGNIQSVNKQALGTDNNPTGSPSGNSYEYTDTEWKDKLSKINGYTITYDAIGNPMSYRNDMTFTWTNGRTLASITTGDNTLNFKYDSNGIRTQKSYGDSTTNYYYDTNNNLIGLSCGEDTLFFYYDTDGNVISFSYNGTMYYYIKNIQGDIVKIIDQAGAEQANYVYDAWGNILSETGAPIIRMLNPFRYRGYLYDTETGLYYLKSRYYDPITGRFVNADVYCDTQTSVLGTNMFAYCENNAITFVDMTGYAKATISSRPSLSNVVKKSIGNSKLNKKRGSVMSSINYYGKSTSGKYEVHTFKKVYRNGYYNQSQYYILRKTYAQWKTYIKDNWGGYKATLEILNTMGEFVALADPLPAKIRIAGGAIYIITTVYSTPKQEKYISNQLFIASNWENPNQSNSRKITNSKILVCMKVVNKKYSQYYDRKTRKTKHKCFENNTYMPY